MQTFVDLEIRGHLADYIDGRVSLAGFEDWFVPVSMSVEGLGNFAATELAHQVELAIAEYTGGYWTENEVKDLLRPLARSVEITDPGVPRASSSSRNRTSQTQLSAALP